MAFTLEQLNQQLGTQPSSSSGNSLSLAQLNSQLSNQDNGGGFISNLYKGIAGPVVNLIARPGQAVQHLLGDTQPIEGKFLGLDINDPYADVSRGATPGSVVLRDIGRGLETVALGVGGGAATDVAETTAKGLIKQGFKQGAIGGAKAGALSGAGQSFEQGNGDFGKVAYDTLFGAGTGALLGGTLGGIAPTVGKGVITGGELKTGLTTEKGLIENLAERNKKVLNPTQRMNAVEERFFKDTPTFIAKEYPDMPIHINKGRLDLTEGIDGLSQKYNAEELAFDSLLKNNGKFVDLTATENEAKKQAMQIFSGTQREKALQQIEDEVSAFARQAQQDGYALDGKGGKVLIPSDKANIFKRNLWQRTKGFGSPESEIYNQSNYLLGSAFKGQLEKVIDDAPVKAMNQRLGDFISAIKYLEKRNGGVPGSGGKMSRYFIRTMGSIAGSGGGIPGSITGAITADKLATFMANPELTTSMYNKLLKRVAKEGKTDILQQAEAILNQRAQKAAEVLKLPAPEQAKMVNGVNMLPRNNNPIITPSPTTYESPAKIIRRNI